MTDIREATEFREVWFIFSPVKKPWANLRIATFTKACNAPFLELVVIHNELKDRMGVRVWDDIVQSEHWVKVRQIEVPTAADVMAAVERELASARRSHANEPQEGTAETDVEPAP